MFSPPLCQVFEFKIRIDTQTVDFLVRDNNNTSEFKYNYNDSLFNANMDGMVLRLTYPGKENEYILLTRDSESLNIIRNKV